MVERDDLCPFCGEACGHWAAAVAERDRLRSEMDQMNTQAGDWRERALGAEAERDRLRAVVQNLVDVVGITFEGGRMFFACGEYSTVDPLTDEQHASLRAALDGSGVMGGSEGTDG